jgi:hypothetical protein
MATDKQVRHLVIVPTFPNVYVRVRKVRTCGRQLGTLPVNTRGVETLVRGWPLWMHVACESPISQPSHGAQSRGTVGTAVARNRSQLQIRCCEPLGLVWAPARGLTPYQMTLGQRDTVRYGEGAIAAAPGAATAEYRDLSPTTSLGGGSRHEELIWVAHTYVHITDVHTCDGRLVLVLCFLILPRS